MKTSKKTASLLNKMKKDVSSWGEVIRVRKNIVLKNSGTKILDIGCSKGAYVKYLREAGYDAWGCDLLKDDSWNGNYKDYFQVADIYNLPYKENSFDTIILFDVLEHLSNPAKALKEVRRITKKNIIVTVPNCEMSEVFPISGFTFHHWIDRTHVNFFNATTFRKIFETNNFIVKEFQYLDSTMPEALFLYAWHIPLSIAAFIGKACQLIPLRKKYFMSLMVVANKV